MDSGGVHGVMLQGFAIQDHGLTKLRVIEHSHVLPRGPSELDLVWTHFGFADE